ncbi:hypothetical protein RB653_000797 [Dictyostelium firmibasis]|uniref:PH domain-containing protein n=1 Tax=Dictyostelium firmibasis TaxID=79012 RepID=A0AAN7UFT4_9MYCE
MGKTTERKKELLELFEYEKIKGDVSYSSIMKKAGGNGKGFLDRYFALHRNYVLYYKLGKSSLKPDDKQEPQGYINLMDCNPEETKEISPLMFQISHKQRTYIVKAKDDSSMKQFLTLLISRIISVKKIEINKLGSTLVVIAKVKKFSEVLTNPLILPDRVSPDMAEEWVKQMKNYNASFNLADPFIKQVEQISEFCRGDVKEYIDWFGGPEGPRLAMIRCEETVLSNWVEYINKTISEITTYQDNRFFREDFKDVITHLKNMTTFIDCYNDYMIHCRKYNNNKPNTKFLEEKQTFKDYIEKFIPKVSSFNDVTLYQFYDRSEIQTSDGIVTINTSGTKKLINQSGLIPSSASIQNISNLLENTTMVDSNKSLSSHEQQQQQQQQKQQQQMISNSKDCFIGVSTNNFNDGNSEYPTFSSDFDFISASTITSPILSSETPSNGIVVVDPITPGRGGVIAIADELLVIEEPIDEKWHFDCSTSMIFKPPSSEDGRNEGSISKMSLTLSGGFDMKWVYQCGYFKSKNMGSIAWNGKHWCWSHQRTSYRIKFAWDSSKQIFINIPFKSRAGASSSNGTTVSASQSTGNLQSSISSMSSLSSLNGSTTKRGHPTTLYPDYQFKDNVLTPIIVEGRHCPSLTLIDSPSPIPNACLLTIAMTQYIQDALIHIGIGPKVLSSK